MAYKQYSGNKKYNVRTFDNTIVSSNQMGINYQDILRQLEPYKNKVFYYGMTDNAISDIEKQISAEFPSYFKQFLKIFGVRQDFIFGLIHREIDFVESSKYLPDDIKKKFVLVGDNCGEDFWLLNSADENDINIYEWEHWKEGEIVKLDFDFKTLLENSIEKLAETHSGSNTNSEKNWCVQFAIPTNDEELIYATIPIFKLQKWNLKEVSPAKVYCYETIIKIGNKTTRFTRQEYQGWETPIYYFNLKEPVDNFGKASLIKDLDNKLKDKFNRYKLIDYGILALADKDDD